MKSIAELNTNQKSAEGHEFEYLDGDGKETGIFVTVMGEKAPPVRAWLAKRLNNRRIHEENLKRRGKQVEVQSVEDDIAFGIEYMAIRVIAWRGLKEPCTPENVIQWLSNDDLIVEQIKRESENIANFTKSRSPS